MEPCIAGPRENTPRTSTSCSADVEGPRDAWSAGRVWPGKTAPTRHKDSSSRFITKTGPPSYWRLAQNLNDVRDTAPGLQEFIARSRAVDDTSRKPRQGRVSGLLTDGAPPPRV